MTNNERVYSDEEFGQILRTASELATTTRGESGDSTGLTLQEMQSAAAQAGIDPLLIARAAKMLDSTGQNRSMVERLLGGAIQHRFVGHYPLPVDADLSLRLLSSVRIHAGSFVSSSGGMATEHGARWDASGGGDVLKFIVSPDERGSRIAVTIDRRGTLTIGVLVCAFTLFLLSLFSIFGVSQLSPSLTIPTLIIGTGGVFGIARRFWGTTSRRSQETLRRLIQLIDQNAQ